MAITHDRHHRRHRGFTLIEATISLVIVAVMLLSALATLAAIGRHAKQRINRDASLHLAHALMSEILQSDYRDRDEPGTFGLETGEATTPLTRTHFDDIDDYSDYSDAPPQDKDGNALDGGTGYQRKVTVEYVDPDDPAGPGSTTTLGNQSLKRITVTVTAPDGLIATLTSLRASTSTYDYVPNNTGTFVRWVGVKLQISDNGAILHSGTSNANQVPLGDAP